MLVKPCLKKEWENLSLLAKLVPSFFLCSIMLMPYWMQTILGECYYFCIAVFGRTSEYSVSF